MQFSKVVAALQVALRNTRINGTRIFHSPVIGSEWFRQRTDQRGFQNQAQFSP
ncbi:MAG: hypothetical protein IPI80_16730 [Burkholderiales bacterium]|jgi:hypothetical protein|nr:hypothetical protein [Burkholderiales bacterium]